MKRRTFINGCCSAIAALSGSRVTNLSFAQDSGPRRDILVHVFLRGGMDGLSFLVPHGDTAYQDTRRVLSFSPAEVLDLDGFFGLHPSAAPLKELFDSQHLALIHACGLPIGNRSHFQAQDYIERGRIGEAGNHAGGWISRHLQMISAQNAFDAVSMSSNVGTTLESFPNALAMTSLDSFTLNGNWAIIDDLRRALRSMYSDDPGFSDTALKTLDIADMFEGNPPAEYKSPFGIEYPGSTFARSMRSVAQLIRMDLGLQVATVDLGGWDTHEQQASGSNPASGQYADLVKNLSEGLAAFWNDLQDYHGRLTVVVMSEFGRRVKENDNNGTDHGHGGVMMTLSKDLAKKQVWGRWPGLAIEQLFERVDLDVTTDYRTVMSEILISRLQQDNLQAVFPEYQFQQPLGLFGITTGVDDWSMQE